MKKLMYLAFAFILMLATLTACNSKPSIVGTWHTNGSIIGLEDETHHYSVFLTFNEDNTGTVLNIYEDETSETFPFEYSTFNNYITFISYDGEVLDKDIHTYPYSTQDDVLIIEVDNKKMEFGKLKYTATETGTTQQEITETYHPDNTYAILRAEAKRINTLIWGENSESLLPFDVTSMGIDDSNSVIVVSIKDITDEKIQYFKEHVSDKDFIVFEEGGFAVFTAE